MSKILDLMFALDGDPATNDATAANTPTAGNNTKLLATTEFVQTGLAPKAPLASPEFTGSPTAPTQTFGDNTTKLATTEFVQTGLSPKAPIASPTFTGTPAAPTPALDDNTTKLATTAFLRNEFTGAGKRTTAAKGHQALPGGLILNWGSVAAVGSDGYIVEAFSKPFPTAFLCAVVTGYVGNSAGGTVGSGSYNFLSLSALSHIRLVGSLLAPCTFSYVAIGY